MTARRQQRVARVIAGTLAAMVTAAWVRPARAEPVDGTVFIRLIGNIQVLRGDDARLRREVLLGLSDVPVASGSGFIVSPDGWIITNLHVLSGERRVALIAGEKVEITVDVQRIEVVLPGSARDPAPRAYQASLTASDADLDLAVLYVSGQELPYVPLGDSDAIASGAPVRAIGYPLAEALELAKLDAGLTPVPDPTVSPGAVSSLRRDPSGDVRYLQTTAPLLPGNSGGPIVDEDGYVVAVAQLEVRDRRGRGVGFGIPVNIVKQFLRRHGFEQRLPARLLGLGGSLDAPAKGVRLPVPDLFADHSPFRLRVDTAMSDPALTLRVDRFPSARTLDQIEAAFLNDGVLDRVRASGSPKRTRRTTGERRTLEGFAKGIDPSTGQELSVLYSIVDLGRERVVARYLGTPEIVAMNRSILQASLAGLEARPLLTGEATRIESMTWSAAAGPPPTPFVIPGGWVVEPGGPSPCGGLADATWSVSASPTHDFTMQMRAAWRSHAPGDLAKAARGCGGPRSSLEDASYVSSADWWGSAYHVAGAFMSALGGVWHLEVIAPLAGRSTTHAALTAWMTAVRSAR
jgi:S1-C subfamily serine protease